MYIFTHVTKREDIFHLGEGGAQLINVSFRTRLKFDKDFRGGAFAYKAPNPLYY